MESHNRFEQQTGFEGGPAPGPTDAPQPTGQTDGAGGPAPQAGKADLAKRIIAAVIDGVIAGVVSFVPAVGGLVAAAYMLLRDGFELEFMDRRSIGKKLLKLRPVTLDGSPMDMVASAKRNWMFALGGLISILLWLPIIGWLLIIPVGLAALALGVVELVLVLTDPQGRRLGDRIANTMVVEEPGA